jgi:DNA-directed RNA polymerase specialized sigma24 family protein
MVECRAFADACRRVTGRDIASLCVGDLQRLRADDREAVAMLRRLQHADVEDLVQDVEKAALDPESTVFTSPAREVSLVACVTKTLDSWAKKRRRRRLVCGAELPTEDVRDPHEDWREEDAERRAKRHPDLGRRIEALPHDEAVVVKARVESRTFSAIATELGISVGEAKARFLRGQRLLVRGKHDEDAAATGPPDPLPRAVVGRMGPRRRQVYEAWRAGRPVARIAASTG